MWNFLFGFLLGRSTAKHGCLGTLFRLVVLAVVTVLALAVFGNVMIALGH